ncbi:hypothetical protein KAR91_67930 [Candidatus Pacearchaeota archaeon]|nr:hypothetical protein [Candidatus Pacearchaeota archaeon]
MENPKEGQIDRVKQPVNHENRFAMSRRSFVRNLAMIVGIATIAPTSIAKAEEPRYEDPYYSRMKGDLQDQLVGKKGTESIATPEGLSEEEVEIMDKSMHIFFKHYLYLDFWGYLAGQGTKEECEKILLLAMKNRDDLHYEKEGNLMTIKGEVTTQEEDETQTMVDVENPIFIEIDGGKIIKIGKTEINYRYVENFEEQWKVVLEKIKNISQKMAQLRLLRVRPGIIRTPIVSEAELKWYEKYSFELPRRLRELLKIKSGSNLPVSEITADSTSNDIKHGLSLLERLTLKELDTLLQNHPNRFGDGEKPQLVVQRLSKTPDRAIEVAWMIGKNAFKTFARFSIDGFVLNFTDWKEADTREHPFAETYEPPTP